EDARLVQDVCETAAHPGSEVAPRPAKDDDAAARHVLAAVVADTLDNRNRAAVTDGEPLAGDAANERLAARGAVERDVADDDVGFGGECRLPRREDRELASREPLADIVVRVAFERQRDAGWNERPEALPGRALAFDADRAVGQSLAAPAPRHL